MRTRRLMNRVGSRVGRTSGGGALFSVLGTLDPLGWYDASQETGYSDNDAMTAILDFSGNGNDLAGDATYKTAVQNSLPIFRFNGTSDLMVASFTLAQPCWRFIVFKLVAVNAGAQSGVAGGDTADYCQLYFNATTSSPLITFAAVAGRNVTMTWGTTNFGRCGVVYNGASTKVVAHAEAISSPGNPGGNPMGGASLGGRPDSLGFARVDIGECIVGSGALSDAVMTQAMTYLKNKWGVT